MASVFLSDNNFTKPMDSETAKALPLAANGNLPTLYLTPLCFNSFSFFPTQAISG